ncbi:hypothetical protein NN561_003592 [Cricetulus griseus]
MYNWKTNYPSFSENSSGLMGLLESLMYSHQPTWDDCQQLLQVVFTTEERERILLEARKNVPGPDGTPTNLPNLIDAAFPLVRPDWDYNSAEGRGRLTVYRRALVAGLKGATWRPTNLAKPATLLPEAEDSTPVHRCIDVLAEETGTRKDLTDQPWPGVPNWYTDRSSFVVEGKRRVGATVVDGKQGPKNTWMFRPYPYKMLHGGPSPLTESGRILDPCTNSPSSSALFTHLKALEVVKTQIWNQIKEAYTPGTTTVPHGFQVGDSVLVRRHRAGKLEPRWKGPYLVLLTMPMAVKVKGIAAWIHASHIKKAPSQNENNRENNWTVATSDNPLKLRLRRSPNLGE